MDVAPGWGRGQKPSSLFGLSDMTPWGSGSAKSPFASAGWVGAGPLLLCVFAGYVTQRYCLTVFCLTRLLLSWACNWKDQAFVGAFLGSAPIAFFGFPVSPVFSLLYVRPQGNPRKSKSCYSVGLASRVRYWSAFSPPFGVS